MSQVTSPFLWRNQPSSLGLPGKTVTKPSLEPKRLHVYQKAVPVEQGCYFCDDAEETRKAAL